MSSQKTTFQEELEYRLRKAHRELGNVDSELYELFRWGNRGAMGTILQTRHKSLRERIEELESLRIKYQSEKMDNIQHEGAKKMEYKLLRISEAVKDDYYDVDLIENTWFRTKTFTGVRVKLTGLTGKVVSTGELLFNFAEIVAAYDCVSLDFTQRFEPLPIISSLIRALK